MLRDKEVSLPTWVEPRAENENPPRNHTIRYRQRSGNLTGQIYHLLLAQYNLLSLAC